MKQTVPRTNLLVIGCLHGKKPRIRIKGIDAIIATGDFCHDKIRPFLFAALRDKQPWWQHAGGKRNALALLKQSFRQGKSILRYLNSFGIPAFVLPGNWDFATAEPWMRRAGLTWKQLKHGLPHIIDCHNKRHTFHGYALIGHGITSGPEYPQHCDIIKRLSTAKLRRAKKKYVQQFQRVSRLFTAKPTLFITHNVPFNTKLDKIVNKKSPRNGMHFGSVLARDIVRTHQPLVCLGAHMHEHYRSDRIGKTVCVNTGFGPRCGVRVQLTDRKAIVRFLSKKYG